MLGVSVIAFILTHVVPSDPIIATLGEHAKPEQVEALREKWALDEPLYVQYWLFLEGLSRGDLGISIRTRRPVTDDLIQYFPATFELSSFAVLISILLGIPVGVLAATRRDQFVDHITRILALTGASMPVFWLGLILVAILYYHLGWFPASGRISMFVEAPPTRTNLLLIDSLLAGNWKAFADAIWHLVLPAFCLGYASTAIITRMTRSSMLEVIRQDYITTARAKGVAERIVVYKHALRNALIPTVTVIGLSYGSLLSGAVLTESIFSWPGLGRYATNSMINVDVPAVMGVALVIALVYSIANLLVDLAYGFLNPTIRYN
jgi:peptide/nickel transport system permease protein